MKKSIMAIVILVVFVVIGGAILAISAEKKPVSSESDNNYSDSNLKIIGLEDTIESSNSSDKNGANELISNDEYIGDGEVIQIKETSKENQRLLEAAASIKRNEKYVRNSMSGKTFRINGEDIYFEYKESERQYLAADKILSYKKCCIEKDYYQNDAGLIAITYKDSNELLSYNTQNYNQIDGDRIDEKDAKTIALSVAKNTDSLDNALANATISVRTGGGNRYYVTITNTNCVVDIALDLTGGLQWIHINRNAVNMLTVGQKGLSDASIKAKIEEMQNEKSGSKCELISESYEKIGDTIMATFAVEFYPIKDSDASSVYQYYYFYE